MAKSKRQIIVEEKEISPERKAIIHRISRIVGQLNGVKKMIEENRSCGDILIQLMAVSSSLKSSQRSIFEQYFKDEYVKDINNPETLHEVFEMLKRI